MQFLCHAEPWWPPRIGIGRVTTSASSLPRSTLGLLFAVQCVLSIGNAGMFAAMPSIGRSIGIPDAAVTGIFSVSALLWVISSSFWARMCDRFGRRSLILVGLAGFVISMGAAGAVIDLALVGHLSPWSAFALLLSARAIFGALGSAAGPAGQAYAIERTGEGQRTRIISALSSATATGTLAGPLLTPFAIALWGPPMPFYLFAGLAIVAVAAVLAILAERNPVPAGPDLMEDRSTGGSIWREPAIRPYFVFALVAMTAQTAQAQTLGFLVIDVLRLPPVAAQPAVALAMAAGAVAALVGQFSLVWLRVASRTALVGAAVMTGGAALALALAETYGLILIASVVQGFGFGLARPAFVAAASLSARGRDQARVAGAFASINGMAMLAAPVFTLVYGFDRHIPFILAAVAMAVIGFQASRFTRVPAEVGGA